MCVRTLRASSELAAASPVRASESSECVCVCALASERARSYLEMFDARPATTTTTTTSAATTAKSEKSEIWSRNVPAAAAAVLAATPIRDAAPSHESAGPRRHDLRVWSILWLNFSLKN